MNKQISFLFLVSLVGVSNCVIITVPKDTLKTRVRELLCGAAYGDQGDQFAANSQPLLALADRQIEAADFARKLFEVLEGYNAKAAYPHNDSGKKAMNEWVIRGLFESQSASVIKELEEKGLIDPLQDLIAQ